MPFLIDEISNSLLDSMSKEVSIINAKNENIIQFAKAAVLVVKKYVDELRSVVDTYRFESPAAEIHFFKSIKPCFYSQLLYYSCLYKVELNKPVGDVEIVKKYFIEELQKINSFFESNKGFYQYMRDGSTYLDHIYFLRSGAKEIILLEQGFPDFDQEFSTGCDYKVAKIEADKMLCDYLIEKIQASKGSDAKFPSKQKLEWVAQKSSLVELLYALHASGTFNNPSMEIKTIANYFSDIFNVDLGNIYKTYEEIRLRKKNRTVFLDSLRNNLLRKMEADD